MKFKIFIFELINRCFLIFLNWFLCVNSLYFYKNIIFFVILKKLIFQKDIACYIVYNNITELLSVYFSVINFIIIQFTVGCFLFHLYVFICPALFYREYRTFKTSIFLMFIVYLFVIFTMVNLIPNLLDILRKYQEPFMVFEFKVNEFLNFFIKVHNNLQLYFIVIFIFLKFYSKIMYQGTNRKHVYFLVFIFFVLFDFFIDFGFIVFITILIFLGVYEILLFYFLLKIKLKI